jgi:hypothetical protein
LSEKDDKKVIIYDPLRIYKMSNPSNQDPKPHTDVVESIVPLMPIVLPIGGAILIFLLAFIAVFMA